MNKIKELYFKIICYDPIIETLKVTSNTNTKNMCISCHSASQINPTRKHKGEYKKQFILYCNNNKVNILKTDNKFIEMKESLDSSLNDSDDNIKFSFIYSLDKNQK